LRADIFVLMKSIRLRRYRNVIRANGIPYDGLHRSLSSQNGHTALMAARGRGA
jgi:hypothetical protein